MYKNHVSQHVGQDCEMSEISFVHINQNNPCPNDNLIQIQTLLKRKYNSGFMSSRHYYSSITATDQGVS